MPEKDEGLVPTPDYEHILACLNAEVNVLADPELRDSKRIDKFVQMARKYIAQLAKAKLIIEKPLRNKIGKLQERLATRNVYYFKEIQEAKKRERERIREDILGGKPVGLTNDKGDMIFPTGYDIPANSFIYFVSQEALQALKEE